MLECGIVGLPNVGKSTLFNALTKAGAASSNYPFCTIDPNVGVVDLIDPRLEALSKLSHSKKIVYATMKFVDIAGLVKGASEGQGLGNQFLSHIRQTDAIVHVVRCFEDENIIHVSGKVDPLEDIETIELELILADLQSVQNILSKMEKQLKSHKELKDAYDLLEKIKQHLDQNKPVRSFPLGEEQKELLKPYPFLTQKKILFVANVSEEDLLKGGNLYVRKVEEYAKSQGAEIVVICAKIEAEIAELPAGEQREFLESLGLEETGLNRLVRSAFHLLGLITYLTTGEMETRAWTIREGESALLAAGKIHTDIQKGFIRAEVISYDDMIAYKGKSGARDAGRLRAEGRDYIVSDGDVIEFLHN